jgi:8-oxo-dGTP pyrophosphatase MutT (NUDIX family)
MPPLPNGFYRVSIKALILDASREKFAVILEDSTWWELPGGGMDHGGTPEECIRRELKEEMGLQVTHVAADPSYYLIGKNMKGNWTVNLVFETTVADLNFTPSEECRELRFVNKADLASMHAFRTVMELGDRFDVAKHKTT